jgi:hypothetical protein
LEKEGKAMSRTTDNGFDAAIVDRDNHAVALVQVKAHPVEKWTPFFPKQTAKLAERVAFVLTIDPNHIQVYRPAGNSLGEPIVHLDTPQVLQQYDPELPNRRVFESYLLTLVEAWLRDLAYHWKSENPPGSEELGRAGLLEKLEGGTTQRLGA